MAGSDPDSDSEDGPGDGPGAAERALAVLGGGGGRGAPRGGAAAGGGVVGVRDEPVPEGEFNLPPAAAGRAARAPSRARLAPEEAPQPRVLRERAERQAGYALGKKDVTKWQAVVKENREADTIVFKGGLAQGVERAPSTAAMAAKVTPQSELEREVAELLKGGAGEVERAQMDALEAGAEANEAGAEERRERLMRMRHLMFQHEMKQKRVRKIKSKDYHRRLKKKEKRLQEAEREGADGLEGTLDLEGERGAREAAEYARAEERLTLRHKNTSRWARRALKRGMANMDDGMKKALGEQLRLNEALRKKVEMAGSDSDSDSEDDEGSSDEGGEGGGGASAPPAPRRRC